jgi:hypothetical protein
LGGKELPTKRYSAFAREGRCFADFPGIPEKKPRLIFPASETGKVLRETNVTHVPMRELSPAWRLRRMGESPVN